MIPGNRAVIGKDLDTVRQQCKLDVGAACLEFGLSMNRWSTLVRQGADEEVKDPTLALLVRLLDAQPELSITPQFPTAREAFDLLSKFGVSRREFATLAGCEVSATHRWLTNDSLTISGRASPAASRLFRARMKAIEIAPEEERLALIESWKDIVRKEAAARGVADDVFKSKKGKWSHEPERDQIGK